MRSAAWETVKDGLVDQGWKDTVLVMPGERVRVVIAFRRLPRAVSHPLPQPGARRRRHDAAFPKSE